MERVKSEPWRVIYISRGTFGLVEVKEIFSSLGHQVVAICTSAGPKSRRTYDYLNVVKETSPDTDIIISTQPKKWAKIFSAYQPDLIFVLGCSFKIPIDVLELPRLGAINCHGAILPKYRGMGPTCISWAIRNDDKQIGWTVHRMDAEFDTGNILAQGTVPFTDEDDIDSVWPGYSQKLFNLVSEALSRVAKGEPGTIQDKNSGTYVRPFEESWRNIDWNQTARHEHNRVRSWIGIEGPRGAIGEIEGVKLVVTKTRLTNVRNPETPKPGSLIKKDGSSFSFRPAITRYGSSSRSHYDSGFNLFLQTDLS